jgi:DNA invertase Pin-like site-specific DNA recombinase
MIEVETSSQKDQKVRKIDILLEKLAAGDTLLVAELSRLGRNMLEVLNLVNKMIGEKINLVFVRQPELSTTGSHGKLLFAIYSYFAETEREFISVRTKQCLAAARGREAPWPSSGIEE